MCQFTDEALDRKPSTGCQHIRQDSIGDFVGQIARIIPPRHRGDAFAELVAPRIGSAATAALYQYLFAVLRVSRVQHEDPTAGLERMLSVIQEFRHGSFSRDELVHIAEQAAIDFAELSTPEGTSAQGHNARVSP